MHIVRFDGGLGNQMFEYAFYLSLKQRHPWAFYGFDTYSSDVEHYGFELDKVFGIDSSLERKLYPYMRKLERHGFVEFTEVKEENFMSYDSFVYNDLWTPHYYRGFWQIEKYFISIKKKIEKAFRFNKEKLSYKTKQLSAILNSNNCISLHIRRGDYLYIENMQTFDVQYYHEAVDYSRSAIGGKVIVFSDDIDWSRSILSYEDMIFVDWNLGEDSWQDMYLMTQCKHNIIANSTFSWWGAWLNNNPQKIVIAPKKWTLQESNNSDIIPSEWIRL